MGTRTIDLVGHQFGRLIVEAKAASKPNGSSVVACWQCKCSCGSSVTVRGSSLRKGETNSCGCLRLDRVREKLTKHGAAKKGKVSPEYAAYHAMKRRCSDPKNKEFKNYGARGIAVCSSWLHGDGALSGFEVFLSEMGEKPSAEHTVDRIDNDKGYSISNCRWATKTDQVRNRRNTVRDNSTTVAEIAVETGIAYHTLMDRWRAGDRGQRLRRSTAEKHLRGESNPRAKLTTENVLEIITSPLSCAQAGDRFGVSANVVNRIRRGLSWKHVTGVSR